MRGLYPRTRRAAPMATRKAPRRRPAMNAALFPPPLTAPRTLRRNQETAIEMLRESLRTGHRRPILQLPTGAGKTRIAAEIVLGSLSKARCAILVVPRISLIEQTVSAFEHEGIWNVGVIP